MTKRKIFDYFLLLRPYFWLPAICPAIAGLLACNCATTSLMDFLILIIIFGPLVSGGAEAINDFYDVGIDNTKNQNSVFGIPSSGGSGVLQKSGIKPIRALWYSNILFSLALIISLFISIGFFLLVLTGIISAIFYSSPPIRLKGRGILGCLIQAFGYGVITFCSGWYIGEQSIGIYPILAGGLTGIAIIGFGSTADLADYLSDAKNNVRTLPILIGKKNAKLVYQISILIPLGIVLIMKMYGLLDFSVIFYIVILVFSIVSIFFLNIFKTAKEYSVIHMTGVLIESAFPFLFVNFHI